MKENLLQVKTFVFAIRIINLYKYLQEKKEFVLSKQLLRSGTAIGAMVSESKYAESGADFKHKLYVGLKEASESQYWLRLLNETKFIDKYMHASIDADCVEIIKLLTSITKKLKEKKY